MTNVFKLGLVQKLYQFKYLKGLIFYPFEKSQTYVLSGSVFTGSTNVQKSCSYQQYKITYANNTTII